MRVRGPGADEERRDHGRIDIFDACRVPAWAVILVDRQRADAFDGFAAGRGAQVEAVSHEIALHAQIVGQRHVACASHLLQRNGHHQR